MEGKGRADFKRISVLAWSAAILFFILLPSFVGGYTLHIFILIFLYAYLGQCWNIVGGYAGQLSFGHATFFGIGAYTSTVLFLELGWSPWIGILAGGLLGGLVGLWIGFLSFRYRLRGIYFALATLAFTEIFRLIAHIWPFVGASKGLIIPLKGNAPWLFQFDQKFPFYYLIFIFMVLSILLTRKIERSKIGLFFKTIRENEEASEASGIDTFRTKLKAISLSAFMTSLGGTFYAQYLLYIDSEICFNMTVSFQMVLGPIIGGVGTILGPMLGAFIIFPLAEICNVIFGARSGVHLVFYGISLILVILFLPDGLIPALGKAFRASLPEQTREVPEKP